MKANTLGELKRSGYRPRTVKEEMRANLMRRLERQETVFPGIIGYEKTVIPQVQNAILSGHDFILLGLRGQAKTRLLRALPALLDDEIPAIEGCEINDNPFQPVCESCRTRLRREGDSLPIAWVARDERYREKLATPDVTIADLIGDIDPIKAATRKLTFADPEVIHFGIIPRTNRGIFAINEIPDLQARIQVGLLNILEEGDIQIRGFPVRLPLDLMLVFSANPEDYTNRGNIITPLRDRISSQIMTHYPRTIEEGMAITSQEAWMERGGGARVALPEYLRVAIEEVAFQARANEFVDQKSGVSARVTIALVENVLSNGERRCLMTGEAGTAARVSDLYSASSAITGKVELVYEGEREGVQAVANLLIGKAVKAVFDRHFPDAYKVETRSKERPKRREPGQSGGPHGGKEPAHDPPEESEYDPILQFFKRGEALDISDGTADAAHYKNLKAVPGLEAMARRYLPGDGSRLSDGEAAAAMEFVLEGLHQTSLLAKDEVAGGRTYKDMFEDMVRGLKR